MFHEFLLFAQAQGEAPKGGGPLSDPMFPILMMGLLFLLWVFILRPMSRRPQQERDAMIATLTKNDKVLTNAGIYGTIISVSEKEDEIVVKIDDNTRVRMIKNSILRNLTREEAAKAGKDTKKEGAA
jgi:preprotein translocase subunit YajC